MNRQHVVKISIAALCISLLPSCGWLSSEKPKFVIANVLGKDAYDDVHIKGSVHVPFEDLEDYAEKNWDKEDTTVVIHCSNYKCTASGAGAKMLKDMGYKKVYAYEAGTAEAVKDGVAVVGPAEACYLNDYKKPEGYDEDHKSVTYPIISTQELKKMMQEFAGN